MPIVSDTIKNLINGISQQDDVLRLPTQGALQTNGYSSVVEGLKKRPPLNHIAKIKSSPVDNAKVQFINRGDLTERYAAIFTTGDIDVFTLEGVERTVNFPDGTGYLTSSTPATDFRAVTVEDYTFVVNKTIECDIDAISLSAANDSSGLVFVKQAVNGVDYKVTIDGTTYTHTTATTGAVSTADIAIALATAIGTGPSAGFTVTRSNYVLKIKKNSGATFTLSVQDSRSGDALKTVKGSVQMFSDLPVVAPDAYIIKVAGDNTNNFDDYYVKFVANDSGAFGEGTWQETVGPGITYKLDEATMPHALVREADTTFTFRELDWDDRTAGDLTSAPNPSFIGNTISDVFFFKNRLGLLSAENVIMSQAGEFFNFYPTTVTTVLDDAPIDVSASNNKVTFLHHALSYDGHVSLFSDEAQFKLASNDILTAKTVSIELASSYIANRLTPPIGLGDNLYFAANNGEFSLLWEYLVENANATKKASNINAHVPTYIPKDLTKLTGYLSESVICCISDSSPQNIFVNKFYWDGESKLQNSWSEWTFDDDITILDIEFFDNLLYIVYNKSDGTYLGNINVAPKITDSGMDYLTHLDIKITDEDCSIAYNVLANTTTYTLPYAIGDTADMVVVTRVGGDSPNGVILQQVSSTDTTIVVRGDKEDQPVFIGNNYEFRYRFSNFFVRQIQQGGTQTIIKDGRLQIRDILLNFANTGYFEVHVTPLFRDPSIYKNPTGILGESGFMLGSVQLLSGDKRFKVASKNDQITIDIVNNTYRPCQFNSAQWFGYYSPKATQI